MRATGVWTRTGVLSDTTVEHVDGRITAVRPGRPGDPPALAGLLVPGLVNAHTHLELSDHGLIPGGAGLFDWVAALYATDRPPTLEAAARGAAELVAHGTRVVGDISNRGDTADVVRGAGLVGVVHHELLTLDAGDLESRLRQCVPAVGRDGVVTRPSPHALFSTAPDLLRATVGQAGPPASIHIAEDPAELEFLRDGTGPAADLLDRLERDWRWWEPPGCSPVAWLDRLGLLGPGLLLVHAVHVDGEDIAAIATAGAPICLCPRSNLHVGGALPPVDGFVAAGVRLALGTDSRASSPDLDVLGEISTLGAAFPQVDPGVWLTAATHGGAAAIGCRAEITPGTAPGLVLLEGVRSPADLVPEPPTRRWIHQPGAAA